MRELRTTSVPDFFLSSVRSFQEDTTVSLEYVRSGFCVRSLVSQLKDETYLFEGRNGCHCLRSFA